MSDFLEHDPWGEIPDWAQSDSEQSHTTTNSRVGNFSRSSIGPIFVPGAQHIIILIDSHPSMFEPCIQAAYDSINGNCISPFDAAIIAAENIIHDKVHFSATTKTGKRDGIGIILYNCPPSLSNGSDTSSTIRNLMSLNPPGVDSIHMIRACSKMKENGGYMARDLKSELYSTKIEDNSDDVDCFEHDFEMNQAYSLRSALYEANVMFNEAKCVKKLSSTSKEVEDSKCVWIFTNEGDPSKGNEEQRCSVQCTVKDLLENGICTRLWSLPRADKVKFNRSLFYDFIITEDDNDSDRKMFHTESEDDLNLEGLLERVSEAFLKVRKLQTVPMYLPEWTEMPSSNRSNAAEEKMTNNSPNPHIMINLYHVIRIKKKPLPVIINSKSRKKTNRVTEILSTETGEIISKERLRYYFEFGNERIYFTKEEIDQIKLSSNANSVTPCLTLIGFKAAPSMSSIIQYPLISRSMFAYPDEEFVKGSWAAFGALHASMVRKKVMAIGKFLYKINGTVRFVAVIPQEEVLFENGEQNRPPGFIIMPLAFEDDIRAIPDNGGIAAERELVEAAENMIRHLNLDRDIVIGESFGNPALQAFWDYIESVALGTPLSEKLVDHDDTSWDVKSILSACGQHIEKFNKLLPENENMVTEKKRKPFSSDIEVDDIDWINEFNQNTLDKLSVNHLKCYLRSKGEPITGRKSDLIARIKMHISVAIRDELVSEKV
jgi:ATP-dependent DNA helicase 2 subunit 1